jgi:hypothetical protein
MLILMSYAKGVSMMEEEQLREHFGISKSRVNSVLQAPPLSPPQSHVPGAGTLTLDPSGLYLADETWEEGKGVLASSLTLVGPPQSPAFDASVLFLSCIIEARTLTFLFLIPAAHHGLSATLI